MKSGKVANCKEQMKPPKSKIVKPAIIEKPKSVNEARRKQQRLSIDFDKQYRQIIFKKYGGNENTLQSQNIQNQPHIELNYQCKSSQEIDLDEEEQKDNIQIKKLQFLEEIQKSPNKKHSPSFSRKPQKGIIKMPKEGTIQLNQLKLINFDDEEDDSFEKMFKSIEKDCEQKVEKVDPLKNLLQTINQKASKNEDNLQKLKNAEESYKLRKKQLLQNIQAIKEQNTKPEDDDDEQEKELTESQKKKQFADLPQGEVGVKLQKFSLDIVK